MCKSASTVISLLNLIFEFFFFRYVFGPLTTTALLLLTPKTKLYFKKAASEQCEGVRKKKGAAPQRYTITHMCMRGCTHEALKTCCCAISLTIS